MESVSESDWDHHSQAKPARSEPKFKCTFEDCTEAFRREVELDKHVYKHTGIKIHKCLEENCNKSYTNSTHLKRHMKLSHEVLEKGRVKCIDPSCSKVYGSDSNMKRHAKLMHGPSGGARTHPCPQCGEKFAKKNQLSRHLFSHTGEYPQTCEECGAGFLNLKLLLHHRSTTHNKEGKYCHKCKKALPNWTALVAHQRAVHSTKHSCPECPNKAFYSRSRLKTHTMLTHGPGIFNCPIERCEVTHSKRFKLLEHIRRQHSAHNYSCSVCGKNFKAKASLDRHMTTVHDPTKPAKPEKRSQKPRKDIGAAKSAAATQLSGLKADPIVEKILLAGEGRRLQIQHTTTLCALDTSATDTESEASSVPLNSYAF